MTVRQDKKKGHNKNHIEPIHELFAALEEVPVSVFKPFLPNPEQVAPSGNFLEILFESDDDRRPALTKFVRRPRPKSLVISTKDDLFEVDNEIVEKFAQNAASTYIPVLCLDDRHHPLSAAIVRAAGDRLPFLLMDNAISFQRRKIDLPN